MAKETADEMFIGADYSRPFHIQDEAETTALNISGWALSYMVKRNIDDLDAAALLTETTAGGGIAIAGSFSSTPGSNAQRATVTVEDTDTDALAPGQAFYELKRTDAGFEQVLAYGPLELIRGVHRT